MPHECRPQQEQERSDRTDRPPFGIRRPAAQWRDALLAVPPLLGTLLIVWSASQLSPSWDEAGHLASGLYHWREGRFDAYRVNPPLARLVQSLPAHLATLGDAPGDATVLISDRLEWPLADALFEWYGGRAFDFVFWGRLVQVPIYWAGAALTVAIVRRLTSRSADRTGGAVAIAVLLYSFCPFTLAAALLITPDLAAAVSGLGVVWTLQRYVCRPSLETASTSGLAGGIAVAAKTTWLLAVPVWVAIALIASSVSLSRRLTHGFAAILVAVWFLNFVYLFEGTATPIGELPLHSAPVRILRSIPGVGLLECLPAGLPENFLTGIDYQLGEFSGGYSSYFCGRHSDTGDARFYPIAVFFKSSPMALATLTILGFAGLRNILQSGLGSGLRAVSVVVVIPLLTVVTIVAGVMTMTGFTHHVRYVAIIMPLVYVVAAAGSVHMGRRLLNILLVLSLAAAAEVGLSAPNILGFCGVHTRSCCEPHWLFGVSEFDSTLEWGQGLLRLRNWLERNQSVELNSFGHSQMDSVVAAAGLPTNEPPTHIRRRLIGPRVDNQTEYVALALRALYEKSGRYDDYLLLEPTAEIDGLIFIYEIPTDQRSSQMAGRMGRSGPSAHGPRSKAPP